MPKYPHVIRLSSRMSPSPEEDGEIDSKGDQKPMKKIYLDRKGTRSVKIISRKNVIDLPSILLFTRPPAPSSANQYGHPSGRQPSQLKNIVTSFIFIALGLSKIFLSTSIIFNIHVLRYSLTSRYAGNQVEQSNDLLNDRVHGWGGLSYISVN